MTTSKCFRESCDSVLVAGHGFAKTFLVHWFAHDPVGLMLDAGTIALAHENIRP